MINIVVLAAERKEKMVDKNLKKKIGKQMYDHFLIITKLSSVCPSENGFIF